MPSSRNNPAPHPRSSNSPNGGEAEDEDRDDSVPRFFVLLGPDYAGKSSVLTELRRSATPWRLVSLDDTFLAPEHALIARLRRDVVKDVAPHETRWSPDFLAAMVHTAVVHLRDQLLNGDPRTPAVVDSYYYKFLAKCRLAGVPDEPLLTWWRSFPRPGRVIYLDVTPESAWSRSREGADLNPLEHYGPRPGPYGFKRYQTDLDRLVREEIRDLPVTVLAEQNDAARTAATVRELITDELG
ncbi:hypothetical protein [Streptomyces ortus]|uniref:Thymidylate kinase n=1 Tax=Streptomyces ortus TaxID=2867268 RepID=A0ABT3VFV8_9ACTN|nr:hypothetical protein [Streptomyces ortus]MCX4238829.1 hypothetical protein [Streptomyces ortus]